jgi:hypothetical protein
MDQEPLGEGFSVHPIPGRQLLVTSIDRGFVIIDSRLGKIHEAARSEQTRQLVSRSFPLTGVEEAVGVAAASGSLWILGRNRQLTRFVRGGDGALRRDTSVTLTHRSESMCRIGGQLFVRGLGQDEYLVHGYSASAEMTSAFGEPIASDERLFRDQLSRGRMFCVESIAALLLTFDGLDEARLYGVDGELRWRKRISRVRSMRVTAGWEPEAYVTRSTAEPWDEVWGVTDEGDGKILVYGTTVRADRDELGIVKLWQFMLNLHDGVAEEPSQVVAFKSAETFGFRLVGRLSQDGVLLQTLEKK